MNEQIGISGCFGGSGTAYPIDDIEEAEAAVAEIVETDAPADVTTHAPDLALAQLIGQYAQRVRLLTWAVVAMAVVLVVKELKQLN